MKAKRREVASFRVKWRAFQPTEGEGKFIFETETLVKLIDGGLRIKNEYTDEAGNLMGGAEYKTYLQRGEGPTKIQHFMMLYDRIIEKTKGGSNRIAGVSHEILKEISKEDREDVDIYLLSKNHLEGQ